jgi:acylphosphatase
MEVGAHIVVKGYVQGVGFRFFVGRAAAKLHLKGTVENLFNGDVRIVAEGDRSLIEQLIKEVKVGPRSAKVNDVSVRWTEPQHAFQEFTIL